MRVLEYLERSAPPGRGGDCLVRSGPRPGAGEGVAASDQPHEAAEDRDHPQTHQLLRVAEHVVGEGGDDGGPHRAGGGAV